MDERKTNIYSLFNKCSIKYNVPAINNMQVNLDDKGNTSCECDKYSFCYNKNNPNLKQFCGPDFIFHSWPSVNIMSFEITKNEIIKSGNSLPIIDKIGWCGNIYSAEKGTVEHDTRPLLKKIGDQYPDIFDIKHSHIYYNFNNSNYMTFIDLIKYKYLIDIGGNGYSGRLKLLLFSKRPLLLVDRNYIEYFHNDLTPYIHYIPVKMDLSDLLQQATWIMENYETSIKIADNAFEFACNNFTENKILEQIFLVYNNINK